MRWNTLGDGLDGLKCGVLRRLKLLSGRPDAIVNSAIVLGDASMREMYLENFKPGDRFVSPGITVTESMINDFALAYDPQPFHLDLKAATDSHFGGLIASGIQTLALGFRAFLQLGLFSACGMGSPGLDELRWLRAVRPGDTLRSEVEIIEVRPSRSKSDRGMLVMAFKIRNQHDENVLTMRTMQLTRRRSQCRAPAQCGSIAAIRFSVRQDEGRLRFIPAFKAISSRRRCRMLARDHRANCLLAEDMANALVHCSNTARRSVVAHSTNG